MKKLLLILLGVLMALPTFARDFDYTYEGQTLTYTVISETYRTVQTKVGSSTSAGNYVSGALIIPATVTDGDTEYTVTKISDYAFRNCSDLTSVTIPNSVKTIGTQAFFYCSGMTSVTIPNSVTSIGDHAFASCTDLTSLTIPESVTTIDNYAFDTCKGLTSVTIPNSVSTIGKYAFAYCRGLASVTIGNSVKTIGERAFYGCNVLTEVIYNAENCTSCGSSTLPAFPTSLTKMTIGNNVKTIPAYAFSGCTGLPEVTIPNSVTSIGNYAFSGCNNIKQIYLQDGETALFLGNGNNKSGLFSDSPLEEIYIGRNLTFNIKDQDPPFALQKQLKKVTFGGGITEIPAELLYGCESIEDIVIPSGVTSIGDNAFYQCTALTSISIPNTVEAIGSKAFAYCGQLKKADFESIESLCKISFADINSNPVCFATNLYIAGKEITDLIIPETVSSIGEFTFGYCSGLKSVIISNGVTSIGNYAFRNCTGLSSLTIGESVKRIGYYAFTSCNGLTSVTIPESVTSIDDYAFNGCSGITKVNVNWKDPISLISTVFDSKTYSDAFLNVPENALTAYIPTAWWELFKNHEADGYAVKDYSDDVFKYTLINIPENRYAILVSGNYSGMTTANIPERFTDLTDEANPVRYQIAAIGPDAFKNCTNLTEVNFNSRSILNNIVAGAFENCSELKSIALPNTVKTLGNKVFSGCSSLNSVTMPESLETIGEYAFQNCSNLTSVEIPKSLKYLSKGVFSNSGLSTVEIPGSVISVGEDAFQGSTGLAKVKIGEAVESICHNAFYGCSSLNTVIFGESVQSIGDDAFQGCNALTKAEFASIKSLCSIKFAGHSSNPLGYAHNLYINGKEVTELVIPESVTSIGDYTFYNCKGLTSVTIPNSVTTIGSDAFYSCNGLTSVTLLDGDEIEFANNVFRYTNIKEAYIGRPLTKQVLPLSNLETLTIGNTITEIGASLWKDAQKLSNLTLGSSLKSIGDEAFSGCTALTEVVVPPSVETIGASAFAGNNALASIIMGHSVKTIGDKAYDGCPANIVSITAQTPPTAPNTTFSNYTGKLYLQGQKAVDAYYDAYTCWDRFDGYVMIEAIGIKYDGATKIEGKPGDTFQLTATLMPENVTLPQVFWRSTNPDIATVDENGLVTIHADLSDIMTMSNDENPRNCKIIAESLYADGPVLEVVVNGESGVDDILVKEPEDTTTIDFTSPYDVYNLSGVWVGNSLDGLNHGFYIVHQGNVAKKVAIK